jgi:hypothetical protein
MIGKSIILFGRNGNQIKFLHIVNHGKKYKSEKELKQIKNEVAYRLVVLTKVNCQLKLQIKKVVHRRKT